MEKISLEDTLEKDFSTAVDFEITLAALFSASILISPSISEILYYPTIFTGTLLLSLTLVRQMSLINKFSRSQLIIDKTSPILVISTTYSALYSALSIGDIISNNLPVSPVAMGIIIAFVLSPVWVALYEIFFRDFMLMISIIAYNQCIGLDDSPFRNWAIEKTKSWLSKSLLSREEQPSTVDRIRNAPTTDAEDIPIENKIGSKLGVGIASIVFSGMLLLPVGIVVYLASAPILQTLKLAVLALMLTIATNFVIVIVRFLYARYGRDDFRMSNFRYIRYSIVIYILFGGELLYEQHFSVSPTIVIGLACFVVLTPLALKLWRTEGELRNK